MRMSQYGMASLTPSVRCRTQYLLLCAAVVARSLQPMLLTQLAENG
jgi:hypothetical protein